MAQRVSAAGTRRYWCKTLPAHPCSSDPAGTRFPATSTVPHSTDPTEGRQMSFPALTPCARPLSCAFPMGSFFARQSYCKNQSLPEIQAGLQREGGSAKGRGGRSRQEPSPETQWLYGEDGSNQHNPPPTTSPSAHTKPQGSSCFPWAQPGPLAPGALGLH